MKVLVANSSPHEERGGTGVVLAPFVRGLRAAGAEVDVVLLHPLDIRPCRGCLGCWLSTPGRCVQRDAMDELLPRAAGADTLVLATPLYVDGMNGRMKGFLDRMIPVLEPWFEVRDGRCRHPRRDWFRPARLALVSACGLPEPENFEPLVAHVRAAGANLGCEFAGALLRPYAASFSALGAHGVQAGPVLAACEAAGRELVEAGAISAATQAAAGRELVGRDLYVRAVNASFRRALARRAPDA